jgi:solute carrier family 13 (sodium-dependent dicarboxylate transporter), member 2/3/5
MNLEKRVGLILGPVLFVLILVLPKPTGMSAEAARVAAVAVLMAVWWITEAIPIPATSLLPLMLFPLLRVSSSSVAAAPYANHLIFLFLGGFLMAVTMEKWDLHRRVALHTIRLVGTSPSKIILGFMIASGFLSMWVSNTATTMMMVPIGMAVIQRARSEGESSSFGTALMLSIAFAATIGGMATIIGTPPNTVMVAMVDKMYGQTITFAQWMAVGVPISTIMMIACWIILTRIAFKMKGDVVPGGREIIMNELAGLGKMKKEEKAIVLVGLIVAFTWIFHGFIHIAALKFLDDSVIAMVGAFALFLIPSDLRKGIFLLDWETALKVPWGVMLLFGGGLSLANGFIVSGLSKFIALQFNRMDGISLGIVVIAIALSTTTLTEMTSNTATATLMIPIVGSVAVALGFHPYVLILAVAIPSSLAFMLPVATPPNAVAFGSGEITIPQMMKAGIGVEVVGAIVTIIVVLYVMPYFWGISASNVPAWAAAVH